jgi:RNA polymerase sigma-70 factor, ECF subfamily
VTSRSAITSGPTDQELIRKVADGDGAAFGTIVQRHEDRLYNTVYRLVGSAEDARDLVQETFVKAYQNLDGFRSSSSLYTWLFRIAVNTSLSHRRKRKWLQVGGTPNADGDSLTAAEIPDAAAPDPAAPIMAAETERIVQQALDELDEEQRTVVVLRDIQQCDYIEIAEILGVPPGTVKSRLHRARLVLREKLERLLKM